MKLVKLTHNQKIGDIMITRYKTKNVSQPIARNVLGNRSEMLNSLMNTFHKEKKLLKSNNPVQFAFN